MKTCNKCEIEKQDYEFYKKRGVLNHMCRSCLSIYQKTRFNRMKAILVNEHGGKCEKCGTTGHPAIFDFHHKNRKDKSFNISSSRGLSLIKARLETAKCNLLCACCHRLEHVSADGWDFDFNAPEFKKNIQILDKCVCGREKSASLKFCSHECSHKSTEVIKWPNNLKELVEASSKLAVAKLLGVSDKAVAKRLKNHF